LNAISITLVSLSHELLSLLLSLKLFAKAFLLLLLFLPLLVGDASHDAFVSLCLFLTFFFIALHFFKVALLMRFITLFQDRVLQPFLENLIGCFLLCLFLKPL
jgi:hypothetical protein